MTTRITIISTLLGAAATLAAAPVFSADLGVGVTRSELSAALAPLEIATVPQAQTVGADLTGRAVAALRHCLSVEPDPGLHAVAASHSNSSSVRPNEHGRVGG